MSIAWLNTAALWGLTLIALPIAIHLLVRQHTRSVHYPSLRFVRETALAAFRRRAIQDALLLACRVAIIAAAVLALAGPIVQTAGRAGRFAERLSRAVVQIDDGDVDPQLSRNVFRTQTFQRAQVADAINDAVRWLESQPPSLLEIAFVGAFTKGQVANSDLHRVPAGIGIRFVPVAGSPPSDTFTQTLLTRRDGRPVFVNRQVRLTADATHVVAPGDDAPAPDDVIRVIAASKDQPLADAALRATLDAGLRWPDRNRRVLVVWDGAAITDTAGTTTLRMPVPDPPSSAATAIWRLVDEATAREAAEPVAIPRPDLEAWSRQPQGISPHAQPADEGDRRWLWLIALALLMLEHRLRRDTGRVAQPQQEQRVA